MRPVTSSVRGNDPDLSVFRHVGQNTGGAALDRETSPAVRSSDSKEVFLFVRVVMGSRRHLRARLTLVGCLAGTTLAVTNPPMPAAAVMPTIVTIEWHDGNADQTRALPILQAHDMHATFLVNTGPILAGNAANLTIDDLDALYLAGNEIAGHTLDHVNIQPLSTADARHEVCADRNNLLRMGVGYQPTSLAYPFASFDAASEDVAHYCNYNGASATAGLTLKGPVANTVPPADPYAVRTVNAIKKSTKLTTMEDYVLAAETEAQTSGSAWTVLVFHHLCGAHAHCGPYVISRPKFRAFLDFLQAEAAHGVVVETMQQVIGGPVLGPCHPATGNGCDTSPR
jgi:peptidoglycan/xylan/chitin deacetylase (PgdA/CDA1 family)